LNPSKQKKDNEKLRPGEIKILDSLSKGPKSNKQLGAETGLDESILAKYLKELQKKHFIQRDIDTRKYELLEKSLDTLFLEDIITVLQDALARRIKVEGRDTMATDLWSKQTIVFSTMPDFEKTINISSEDDLEDSILQKWEDYLLETMFKDYPEKQAIVRKYKQYMLILARKFSDSEVDEEQTRGFWESMVKMKYAAKYPNVQIPKEIIATEAEEQYKKQLEAQNMILQPYDIDDLENLCELSSRMKWKKDLTEKELKEIEPMLNYLDDARNRNVYKKFKERFGEMPKTLMVNPLLGFYGYLEQLRRIDPEKAKVLERQMKERQERALKQLVASSKTK